MDQPKSVNALSWKQWLLLILGVAIPLSLQLIGIDRPFRGHFASYQATVMASMARNMGEENFKEILLPKTNLLIVAPEKTLHLNQYPFPSLLVALCVKFMGGSYEFWGRLQAILFNLLAALLLSLIGAKLFGRDAGWIAGVLFLLLPYSILYGQMFICEPMAACFLLAALWGILRKDTDSFGANLAGALFFSLAVANRVHYIFFLPLFLLLLWQRSRKIAPLVFFFVVALALPVAWYWHTYVVGQLYTLTTHTSLFFQAGAREVFGTGLLMSPEYWRNIADLFCGVMLTPLVFPFVFLGCALLWSTDKKGFTFCLFAMGGGLLTLFLAPKKVLDQAFYLYGLFPFLLLAAAVALARISEAFPFLKRSAILFVGILLLACVSARYCVGPLFLYPAEEKNVAAIGQWVAGETQPEDIVILAGPANALLNYYIHRRTYGFSLEKEKVFPTYYMKRHFTAPQRQAIEEMKGAMGDEISLLEHLRKKGAGYILISNMEGGQTVSPVLSQYLETNYSRVPAGFAGIQFFKLKK